MTLDDCLVIVAPCLGSARGDATGALGFNEFDPSRVGKLSSAGSTIWMTWPWAPVAASCVTLPRTSLIGTHRSDSSTISERGDGAKDGGRLARSVGS